MINQTVLENIYNKIKTPFKLGAIIKNDDFFYDSPVVFRYNKCFYMTCVEIDRKCLGGYKTKLFKSNNLINFEEIGYIFKENNGWDSVQTGAYAQLINPEIDKGNEINSLNGKYLFAFIGGNKSGYETDPLSLGIGFAGNIDDISSYKKNPEPILSGKDKDSRFGEKLTIYKPCIFIDEKRTLGHKYVMLYNAKSEHNKESIFLVVSDDGVHYKRYLDHAIISAYDSGKEKNINGDPQLLIIDGYYVQNIFEYLPFVQI